MTRTACPDTYHGWNPAAEGYHGWNPAAEGYHGWDPR